MKPEQSSEESMVMAVQHAQLSGLAGQWNPVNGFLNLIMPQILLSYSGPLANMGSAAVQGCVALTSPRGPYLIFRTSQS